MSGPKKVTSKDQMYLESEAPGGEIVGMHYVRSADGKTWDRVRQSIFLSSGRILEKDDQDSKYRLIRQ